MTDFESLAPFFQRVYGISDSYEAYFSPGRVNLMGEHIDYNGGNVLPFAINLGITALFVPDNGGVLKIYSVDFDELLEVDLTTLQSGQTIAGWEKYVTASLRQAAQRGLLLRAGKIIMQSSLPIGSGLSSSAALECLILFMTAPDYYDRHRLNLALDAQKAEIAGTGVQCGIMDQYAIAFGKKDFAVCINTQNLTHEYVPLDFKNYRLVVMNTNEPRSLSESRYNERREECARALEIVQKHDPAPNLAQSHEISIAHIEDDSLYFRAKHVITEQQRVLAAYDALRLGEIGYLGDLMWMSHTSLDEDFEVAGDALNCLVFYAHKFKQCIGARMTGAGFGGCAIALVEKDSVERFCTYVGLKYAHHQGRKADFYLVESSDSVNRIR